MVLAIVIALIIGYVLGALPFGYLVARAHGVNIFEVGSKNPGATNVRRVLGPGPGNIVFLLDALKGAVAASWPLWVALGRHDSVHPYLTLAQVVGFAGALIGHSFSCFTRFRGGKGVATGLGGLLMLMPIAALIVLAVWIVVFYAGRYVSLASICAALALPVTTWALGRPGLLVGLSVAIAVFVLLRHRTNLVRLLNGTEARFVKKKRPDPAP